MITVPACYDLAWATGIFSRWCSLLRCRAVTAPRPRIVFFAWILAYQLGSRINLDQLCTCVYKNETPADVSGCSGLLSFLGHVARAMFFMRRCAEDAYCMRDHIRPVRGHSFLLIFFSCSLRSVEVSLPCLGKLGVAAVAVLSVSQSTWPMRYFLHDV